MDESSFQTLTVLCFWVGAVALCKAGLVYLNYERFPFQYSKQILHPMKKGSKMLHACAEIQTYVGPDFGQI